MVLWNPQAGGAGGWLGVVPVLVFPHLCCAYLWGLGEGEAHLSWDHWLTKPFQSRRHERGICIPTSCFLAEGTDWIQQALSELLPWDMLAPSVNSLCFTQAGSVQPTMFGVPRGPYGEWGVLGTPPACPAPQPWLHSLGNGSGSACLPSSSLKGLWGWWWLLGRFLLQSPWPFVG